MAESDPSFAVAPARAIRLSFSQESGSPLKTDDSVIRSAFIADTTPGTKKLVNLTLKELAKPVSTELRIKQAIGLVAVRTSTARASRKTCNNNDYPASDMPRLVDDMVSLGVPIRFAFAQLAAVGDLPLHMSKMPHDTAPGLALHGVNRDVDGTRLVPPLLHRGQSGCGPGRERAKSAEDAAPGLECLSNLQSRPEIPF